MKIRFEINKDISGQDFSILNMYLLDGDFSTGKINNISFSFKDMNELQDNLNISINKLLNG